MEQSTKKTLIIGGSITAAAILYFFYHEYYSQQNTPQDPNAGLAASDYGLSDAASSSAADASGGNVGAIPDLSQDQSFQELLNSIVNSQAPADVVDNSTPAPSLNPVRGIVNIPTASTPIDSTVEASPAPTYGPPNTAAITPNTHPGYENITTYNPAGIGSTVVAPTTISGSAIPVSVRNGQLYGGAQA